MDRRTSEDSVNLGPQTVNIQVFDTGLPVSGKTLLITAGMDGDEYCGVEAARRLIGQFRNKKPDGRLIIIPLINVPGYGIGHSRNPMDGLYPKLVFPGKPAGKPSERLIWWLYENYIKYTDVWIDLHSGATDEILTPCILSYETGEKSVDAKTLDIIGSLGAENTVFEKNHGWQKVNMLAQEGISYLIFESGYGGRKDKTDTDRHVKWVNQSLKALNFIVSGSGKSIRNKNGFIRRITEVKAPEDGLWLNKLTAGSKVGKSGIVGWFSPVKSSVRQEIISNDGGIILWQKNDTVVEAGSTLVAVGSHFESTF
jgi:predicted deacylase